MFTPEEVKTSRYRLHKTEAMRVKTEGWLRQVHRRRYRNKKYLKETRRGERVLYGLQSEAISAKRLEAKLEQVMVPLIGKKRGLAQDIRIRKA